MMTTPYSKGYTQQISGDWEWTVMPPVPDTSGFAGAFAGQTNRGIIVAGGANFPDGKMPWEGGVKRWTDKIFFLENDAEAWREYGKLPVSLGYGASCSKDNTIYIAGGSNEAGHHDKVYKVTVDSGALQIDLLPPLPIALANTSGVLVGNTWYIVGGLSAPEAWQAENVCLSLDLGVSGSQWKICPPVPGEGRMLPVLGTDGEALYVFSGVALRAGKRHYLKDAYRYRPGRDWQRLADLPHPVAAAPSPCFYHHAKKQFFLFGGDDGSLADQQPGLPHPGFSTEILVFDVAAKKWRTARAKLPPDILPPVTTTAILQPNSIVLPMGEVKPGVRTAQVIRASLSNCKTEHP